MFNKQFIMQGLLVTILSASALAQSQDNEVYIDQIGDNHRATAIHGIDGFAQHNKTSITQQGTNNSSSIRVGSENGTGIRNENSQFQSGEGNLLRHISRIRLGGRRKES